MHIVLVCREYIGSSRAGGIASYLQEIAYSYIELGHLVTIITASEDTRVEDCKEIRKNLHVISINGGDFINPNIEKTTIFRRFRFLYRFNSYRKHIKNTILKINNKLPIDIIEVADYGAESLYLNDLGIPVVLRLHTPLTLDIPTLKARGKSIFYPLTYKGLAAEEKVFANAKYICSCSNALLEWVHDNIEIHPNISAVVNNPVKIPGIKINHINNDKPVIFYGGTICETKGVGDLITACQLLRSKGIDIQLRLAGKGGKYCTNLQHKTIRNNWDWISFLGKIDRQQMYEQYVSATACCFPSWWENMPMVCLEAMGVGAIVVASTSGGAKEIVQDSINGFLVDRKSPNQLADCIERIIKMDEPERSDISNNARARINNYYSPTVIAKQMLLFYDRTIADASSI